MMIRTLPLLLLLLVFGCARDEEVGTVVIPDVIDIGRVRANGSPINTSFSIANNSSASVTIDRILSGCGCTVIAPPQQAIRPGETVEVAVKIDIFGRRGDFNTDLLVISTSEESWQICEPE